MQEPFNGDLTSSIFISQDPVAIDSVGADFLMSEPTVLENNPAVGNITKENYLHESGLILNPSSGTDYKNGNGEEVSNLGIHEHFNNSSEKKYSRNLEEDEGIELIKVENK